MKKAFIYLAIPASLFLLLYSCQKSGSSSDVVATGRQEIQLLLTDGPAFFDSVFVNITSVSVIVDTCKKQNEPRPSTCNISANLAITPGLYDLLSLRNGVDTSLAKGNIPEGKVKAIKINLGAGNYLVKDGITYPIELTSENASIVLKLEDRHHWHEWKPKHKRMWMDFDVARSIIKLSNGKFYLRPVMHLFTEDNSAMVAGKIGPKEAKPVLTLFNATDTAYALPTRGGEFKIRGVNAGTYSLFVNADNDYKDTTIKNIVLETGKLVKIPAITLHK